MRVPITVKNQFDDNARCLWRVEFEKEKSFEMRMKE